jgi:hypothetical protein
LSGDGSVFAASKDRTAGSASVAAGGPARIDPDWHSDKNERTESMAWESGSRVEADRERYRPAAGDLHQSSLGLVQFPGKPRSFAGEKNQSF